ncbi:metallopeptidase TldD-related protein [Streptomyces parvus]|uniref:metallopeptidase TldD-related protein n=1 Tax=Streptomyces parvus TaxID=66428 RepID=UPI001653CB3C|nr:metallopeptidase TldD-related protein [Streptomyces parvus]
MTREPDPEVNRAADGGRKRFFAEHARRLRREYRQNADPVTESTHRRGACTETHDGRGHVVHRFGDRDTLLSGRGRAVATQVADLALKAYDRPLFTPDEQVDKVLGEVARSGVDVTLGCFHQHVAVGTDSACTTDERLVCTVEVSAETEEGGVCSEVVPWPTALDAAEGGELVARAADTVLARRALPRATDLPEGRDLVLLAGRAGSFFHELVGHPMEADVVASATSYLTTRAGRHVAPEWLTVVDGAAGGAGHNYRAVVDDEGMPSRDTLLIEGGVVREPMTDAATAALLGVRATGNGRRLDYRHPAIPRMTHTRALVADGAVTRTPDGDWIAPLDLQLLTMNIATGEFVFRSYTPLHHREDGSVVRLPPVDLHGQGPRVLAGLEPYDAESKGYGRATKGCGKLGQFPLVVTFANAGVLLPAGLVDVREARDG